MGIGGFDKRLIASAKLVSMEKYGFAYSEDFSLVQDVLGTEITIQDINPDEAIFRVIYNGRGFEVKVRGYIKGNDNKPRNVQAVPERQDTWVSVWDPTKH